ncbi:MAG TPA: hypothetical protein VH987_06590 [Candidatus Limnocylindria bacterium]|jgi:hypothetical protein
MSEIRTVRLHYRDLWVDVRLYELNGRWLASADTPDGPSLRTGWTAHGAMVEALEPFDGIIDQLISSAPSDLAQPSYRDHVGPDY